MATGTGAVAPTTHNFGARKVDLAQVGTEQDVLTKQQISAIGIPPLQRNTLQGSGQGIYADITA